MGFFKCLAYVAGGVGAVVLAPVTGGGSIAAMIGVMGTTTVAGAAIGAGIGAAAAAVDHAVESNSEAKEERYRQGVAAGKKAGERAAQEKYETKMENLVERFKRYQDTDAKLLGLFAVGSAIANADGNICKEEEEELNAFTNGCMSAHLPQEMKDTISKLRASPPSFDQALTFARNAKLPKQDIEDVIDVVANADGYIDSREQAFINNWKQLSSAYEYA